MQTPFPHHYEVRLKQGQSGIGKLVDGEKPQIIIGPPPQFGGKDQLWSPEELLLGSVAACMMTTFFSLVSKNPIEVVDYESMAEGILKKTKSGILFDRIILYVNLQVKNSDIEEATRLLKAAKCYCIVANSLKVDIDFNPVITGHEEFRHSAAV